MKIAYFSPLNPLKSGISDYSEELLPHLARHVELELFVDGFTPSNERMRELFPVHDYAASPSRLRLLDEFDALVYHMGNDHRYHAGILRVMRERPGIVVLHDFALQDFFLGLSRERGDARVYLDEVAACHGVEAHREAEEALARGGAPAALAAPTEFPLNERIIAEAEGVVVHSEWCRSRIARRAPGLPVAHVPMPVVFEEDEPGATHTPSREGGVRTSIANFGLVTPGKGIEMALSALAELKATHDFHYTLVGETNAYFDVRELVRRYRMEDRVTITERVALAEFERQIRSTDIALNIRERTVGETSASLCRVMAAGVAAIVSNVGWYSELPDSVVVKIDDDEHAERMLAAFLARLIEDLPLRERIGANARAYVRANHRVENSAARYAEFIRETIARRTRSLFVRGVAADVSALGVGASDEAMLASVAAEVARLAPESLFKTHTPTAIKTVEGDRTPTVVTALNTEPPTKDSGRLPKIEGIDYLRAALEYPSKLDAERRHYLRTKPFYNLANKPPKHTGEGMDAETHRHFCDFANMAVALALPAGARLLDVGCGSGWLSEYFARLGYDVKGIDVSPDLVEMARERVARVPFEVDHETALRCEFEVHDIERAPLDERFDAAICYDSLHHFEDERAVFRNLAAMLPIGGQLFILEGDRPPSGSATEEELREVMRRYETLESPFSRNYLLELLDANGLAVTGDFISVNGLFERSALAGDLLSLDDTATNYHYLVCKKVCEGAQASSVPDSRHPGLLRARIHLENSLPARLSPDETLSFEVTIENTGDTLWLNGRRARPGVVMPAVRILDARGSSVEEFHGEPPLPRAVAPGEIVRLKISCAAPLAPGSYSLVLDLVAQHVSWFEACGSKTLTHGFEVV